MNEHVLAAVIRLYKAVAAIIVDDRGLDWEYAERVLLSSRDIDEWMRQQAQTFSFADPVSATLPASSVLPARELLADLLLELNQPAAALVEYRAMLSTDPNRFRSLLGEARAAKQTGDSATAHDAYRKLVALSKPVGPARPELAEARSYLTN